MNIPTIPFEAFPKIPRLNREVVVTEKIDGTNALIYIAEDDQIYAGSRSKWITPSDDNFGFARWVEANKEDLRKLGYGIHRGEWWGAGIQRKYGLTEKRFSLFNTHLWSDSSVRPACCGVVPMLTAGPDIREAVEAALSMLRTGGSRAAPGFMKPEGIVAYHTAAQTYFKVTLENDESPKGKVEA